MYATYEQQKAEEVANTSLPDGYNGEEQIAKIQAGTLAVNGE